MRKSVFLYLPVFAAAVELAVGAGLLPPLRLSAAASVFRVLLPAMSLALAVLPGRKHKERNIGASNK